MENTKPTNCHFCNNEINPGYAHSYKFEDQPICKPCFQKKVIYQEPEAPTNFTKMLLKYLIEVKRISNVVVIFRILFENKDLIPDREIENYYESIGLGYKNFDVFKQYFCSSIIDKVFIGGWFKDVTNDQFFFNDYLFDEDELLQFNREEFLNFYYENL